MQNIEAKLNLAKKSRIYKDLKMDTGLQNVFQEYGFKQLMEIKKLHLLYAHQRVKAKQKI